MASKRSISSRVIDTDLFLSMPLSAQALYMHLLLHADDDGFVPNPKSLVRTVRASDDDYLLLMAKKYIIPFESGICVIVHWKIHSYIQADRRKETIFQEEKSMLVVDESEYRLDNTVPMVEEKPKKESKRKYGEYNHVLMTETEYERLKKDYINADEAIKYLDEYIEMKGYKAQNHNLALRKWVFKALEENKQKDAVKPRKNRFNDYTQRQYTQEDFESIERQILDGQNKT